MAVGAAEGVVWDLCGPFVLVPMAMGFKKILELQGHIRGLQAETLKRSGKSLPAHG